MKCIAAVVMMAFIGASNAGLVPLAYSAWSHTAPLAWDGITQYSSLPHHATVIAASPHSAVVVRTAHWDHPHHVAYAAAPVAHAVVAGEARYTAVNRGAVHDAPLPGHALSQTSLNVAPAPGTW